MHLPFTQFIKYTRRIENSFNHQRSHNFLHEKWHWNSNSYIHYIIRNCKQLHSNTFWVWIRGGAIFTYRKRILCFFSLFDLLISFVMYDIIHTQSNYPTNQPYLPARSGCQYRCLYELLANNSVCMFQF